MLAALKCRLLAPNLKSGPDGSWLSSHGRAAALCHAKGRIKVSGCCTNLVTTCCHYKLAGIDKLRPYTAISPLRLSQLPSCQMQSEITVPGRAMSSYKHVCSRTPEASCTLARAQHAHICHPDSVHLPPWASHVIVCTSAHRTTYSNLGKSTSITINIPQQPPGYGPVHSSITSHESAAGFVAPC
jgi:hypothetical protein